MIYFRVVFLVKQYLLQLLTANYDLLLKCHYLKIISIKFPDIGMVSANIIQTPRGIQLGGKTNYAFGEWGK